MVPVVDWLQVKVLRMIVVIQGWPLTPAHKLR